MIHTLFQRGDQIDAPLYVVTPIYNPRRWRSRWKLYEDFAVRVEHAGAVLYTIEVAFGDRRHVIASADNPRHIQLRTSYELWLKERLINLAVQRLPSDWKYVAWVDADVQFARPDWANETIHQLQHYPFVQMWSHYQDLTADYRPLHTSDSFAYRYVNGLEQPTLRDGDFDYYGYYGATSGQKVYPGAPGLAWACTRQAFDTVGGLLDTCILGAGDWYMAHALVGRLNEMSMRSKFTPAYKAAMLEWAERAQALKHNIGYVEGLAQHYWHGPKAKRGYKTRDQILVDHEYNPQRHLKPDWQGLWQLDADALGLRDDIRRYFTNRDEDA